MKKILIFCTCLVFLSACSLKEGIEKSYKVEHVLKPEIVISEKDSYKNTYQFNLFLSQNDIPQTNVSDVKITIWEKDKIEKKKTYKAKNLKDGFYVLEKSFLKDGVYFARFDAAINNSKIFPTVMFIVGEQADIPEIKKEHTHENHDHH